MKEESQDSKKTMNVTEDWFLQDLIDSANNGKFEVEITIASHGLLISGVLVSGKTYFEGIGKQFQKLGTDNARQMNVIFNKIGEDVYSPDKLSVHPGPYFIHLKNAKFYDVKGNAVPSNNESMWWRGLITQISGFTFGSIVKI